MFDTSVHGVVVQTSSAAVPASGPEVSGRRTYTDGSVTVSYPCASSWSDSVVSQRGQYGETRWASNSRPASKICFSDHQTLSMYDESIVQYGVVDVDPVGHPLGQLLERADVLHDRLARHRALNSAIPNASMSRLAGEAELLLDADLDVQALAVPAGLAVDPEALHRLEAGEQVLEDAGLDVVGARLAVRRRRTLEERPRLVPPGLRQRRGEDVVLAPEPKDLVLELGQVELRGNRPVRVAHRGLALSSMLTGIAEACRSADEGTTPACCRHRGTTLLGPGVTCAPDARSLFVPAAAGSSEPSTLR